MAAGVCSWRPGSCLQDSACAETRRNVLCNWLHQSRCSDGGTEKWLMRQGVSFDSRKCSRQRWRLRRGRSYSPIHAQRGSRDRRDSPDLRNRSSRNAIVELYYNVSGKLSPKSSGFRTFIFGGSCRLHWDVVGLWKKSIYFLFLGSNGRSCWPKIVVVHWSCNKLSQICIFTDCIQYK